MNVPPNTGSSGNRRTFAHAVAYALILAAAAATSVAAPPAPITIAGDPILGGRVFGSVFTVGAPSGTDDTNTWPASENPANAIDEAEDPTNGRGDTKYLNFGVEGNAGYIVTPAADSIVTAIEFTTANDHEERDPLTFSLYGSNSVLVTGEEVPGTKFHGESFTVIADNQLTGLAAHPGRQETVFVPINNTATYKTYVLVFPTLRDSATANSMQIGDAILQGQVTGSPTPSPSPAPVQFSSATYDVQENEGRAVLTLQRTSNQMTATTVHFATSGGSAEPGSDFKLTSGDVTFAADGPNRKKISIPIFNDSKAEQAETVEVTLTPVANAVIGSPATATVTIVDKDGPPPTIEFSQADYQFLEKRPHAVLTVHRSGKTSTVAKVHFATSDGTAQAGTDYVAVSGDIVFPADGSTTQTLSIPLINDHKPEPDKTFNVTLTKNSTANVGDPDTATVTIVDGD